MEFPIQPVIVRFMFGLLASLGLAEPFCQAQEIHEIPRLSKNLEPGTLAWATVDQLHPGQPQTGFREVNSTTQDFLNILRRSESDFPTGLYETLLKKGYIIPVHLTGTPPWDSRYGKEEVLGYATDRTHKAAALAWAYSAFFGREGLSEPRFDQAGRVLNFILVRVVANHCGVGANDFATHMIENHHCYLTEFKVLSDGETTFMPIDFWNLPEKMYETTDNPYRGLIGALQRQGHLNKTAIHFAEFELAAELAQTGLVEWDEISVAANPGKYSRALQRAAAYFRTKQCVAALTNLENE